MGNPMEELRVRLDELDVAWWQRKCHTCWKVEKKQGTEHWRAWLAPDGTITLKVDAIYGFTPEQAIAATVGEEHEMHVCKRCGVAYELNIIDKGYGKPRFCPNCGYRGMYQ
jgi:hypothetical protein